MEKFKHIRPSKEYYDDKNAKSIVQDYIIDVNESIKNIKRNMKFILL